MSFLGTEAAVFTLMVFTSVALLAWSVFVPTVSAEAHASRRMKQRIGRVLEAIDPGSTQLLRDKHLKDLGSFARFLETLPGVTRLSVMLQQAGYDTPAYRVITKVFGIAIGAAVLCILFTGNLIYALIAIAVCTVVPLISLIRKRNQRLTRFEEQLPEALQLMARALQAGHPFQETLKMVGEEMPQPIASEFGQVYLDISYGVNSKTAFMALLSRIPSISLNATTTAILIQQESGGKLAEILQKIAAVIRSRFRLQRKVKTLSAEGRMSAWILVLVPFVLAGVIALTTPTYLPRMTKDPFGIKLIFIGFAFILSGILWIRKIINIKY